MSHTPTPWREDPSHPITGYADVDNLIVGADGERVATIYGGKELQPSLPIPTIPAARANAALIIRAVNSHDALVKSLGAIAYEYENQDLNHVDFRVAAYRLATEALATVKDAE